MRKYILAVLFLLYLLPSQAQIFYKERIYGNEDRRTRNTSEEYDYSSQTSAFDSTWINEPIFISEHRKSDRIYKQDDYDSNDYLPLSVTKEYMEENGHMGVVNAIEDYQSKKQVSYKIRKVSRYAIATSFVLLFALPASDNYRPYLYGAFGISAGLNITGKILKYPSKKHIYTELEAYNAGLGNKPNNSFDKNFFPNFRPSKLIIRPVRMNLLTLIPVPTLGIAWNF